MTLTSEQILLVGGIILIVYTLVGGRGIRVSSIELPELPNITLVGLFFFGFFLMSLGVVSQVYQTEHTFEIPILNGKRIDICLYRGGHGCGYEAATTWCRTNGYRISSIWSADSEVGNTVLLGTRGDCGLDNCTAFRTITCMR